ncbi:MAG: four helix bundle protein [Pyrinomonadaceae bacterium]
MQDFRNLLMWQKAHQLALNPYRVTNDFPHDEVFGLRNMMRKTSIDIPAYIAEGASKPNDAEFAKSLSAALGFANRLEYYALMARDLEFLDAQRHWAYETELIEVKKMIGGFSRRLTS